MNGVLSARGTSEQPIRINGITVREPYGRHSSVITFMSSSGGWNEETGLGSVIENAVLNSTLVEVYCSAKIANCTLLPDSGLTLLAGSPVISNCGLTFITIVGGSPTISNNYITGGIEYMNGLHTNSIVISGNVFSGCQNCINLDGTSYGTVSIERNMIIGNDVGIEIRNNNQWKVATKVSVQNNTIVNNSKGILVTGHAEPPRVNYNNFENKSEYNISPGPNDINATYNWWGTADSSAINQTVYDFKNDFNIGTVNSATG
ncbi:MAG: hypothetical protein ACE14S_12625 [Candidatus Bathyarchaeia archaeon]